MANELAILRALRRAPSRVSLPPGTVGPGDDAAVIPAATIARRSLVVSCDALEEGVHFMPGWLSWADLAHKLVAVALSDVAAMGADPAGLLVAIAWPDAMGDDDAGAFGAALQDACALHDAPLLGGDVDVRPGPLRLEATALGACARPVLRSGARAGDGLFVTGPLGGAALCVATWLAGGALDPDVPAQADALLRFRRPRPRLDASRLLRDRATAMIDLSDGLLADATHLAHACELRAVLRVRDVPLHDAVPLQRAVELALEGGEDYELLVAGPPGLDLIPGVMRVGELIEGDPGRVDLE